MELESADRLVRVARERAADRRRSFAWDPYGGIAKPRARQAPPGRPLHVLQSSGGRTLFHYLVDERLTIRVQTPGAELLAPPDVVVIRRADRLGPEGLGTDLPRGAWAGAAEGRIRVIFDVCGEGAPHSERNSQLVHQFLRSHGLRPSVAAYVTQDRAFASEYGAWCDRQGLGADRMQIWLHDLFIRRTIAEIGAQGEEQFELRLRAYSQRRRTRTKQFLSLNRNIRPVKALFLMRLMHAGLFDRGFISLGWLGDDGGGQIESRDQFLMRLRSISGFDDLLPALEPLLDELKAIGPVSFGPRDDFTSRKPLQWALRPGALEEYSESWFSVVTESDASDRLHRITEKPFKPLLNFHLFMVLGCAGALRLVRAYGFDTYPQVFDESYDQTSPLRARHDMILAETQRLCGLDQAALSRLDDEVSETVVFNAWWGLVELPGLFASHIEAQLVDRLVDFCMGPVAS